MGVALSLGGQFNGVLGDDRLNSDWLPLDCVLIGGGQHSYCFEIECSSGRRIHADRAAERPWSPTYLLERPIERVLSCPTRPVSC
jgi:hypothetical protein